MVAEAGLELKQEQSSQNERQKHAIQKVCLERLRKRPPKLCLCELHCFCGTHGYKYKYNHDNLILAWDPDTRWIKWKMRTRYRALLAKYTHTRASQTIGREVWKHSLLKTSQRALWKRRSSTSCGNCHAVIQAAVAACKGPAKHISFTWKMEGSSSVQPWVKAKMKNVIDLL